MKLTTFILIATLLQVSASTLAQKLTLQRNNIKISSVIIEIRKQTGYDVIFDNTTFKETRINANFINTPIDQVMDQLVKGSSYTYTIEDKIIVINSKEPSFSRQSNYLHGNIAVHGYIHDTDGSPLRGATIKIKGTNRMVLSNEKGEFRLDKVEEKAILIVSFVGYNPKEIKAAAELGYIVLLPVTAQLDEFAVVSTGYQNIPKERATGSFSKIDNATYSRQVSTDVISRLKGIAPSMYFDERSTSGTMNLTIRGQSTIYGNAKPLVVVDNFPFEGDLNNLNPNDVQDITILKDAAAASIWGVRAGNGVIVITTKRGHSNQPLKVEFNSNLTIGGKPDLFYQSSMKPTDFIDVEKTLFEKGYYNSTINNTATAAVFSPVVEILLNQRNNVITPDQANAQIDALREYDVRTDIGNNFYQNTTKKQYAINLSGGTDKQNYFLSTSFDQNNLSLVKNDFTRLVINGNQSFRPIKKLEVSAGIYFNQNWSDINNSLSNIVSGMGGGRLMYPYAQLADANGNSLPVNKDFRNSFKSTAVSRGYLNWDLVPLDELDLQKLTNKLTGTRLSAGINYKIIDGLSADVKFQYENQSIENFFYRSPDSYYMRDLINRFTSGTGNAMKRNIPAGGTQENSFNSLNSLNGRAQLNFDHSWKAHQINIIAGFDIRQIKANGTTSLFYGYDQALGTSAGVNYDATFVSYPTGVAATIPRGDSVRGTMDRFRSYYSNAGYTFLQRYTVSASGRIDQSNLFGVNANQRSVPLWSAGLKWDISKEPFYSLSWLPTLSLRSTYGYNGNLDNTITAYTTAVLGRSQTLQTSAAQIRNPANKNLRWERTGQLNLGIDFSGANNRISGSFEYYNKKGKDLIGQGAIDPTSGIISYRGNLSNMAGKGLDVELLTINLNKGLKWSTNYLFSYTIDKVKDYELVPTLTQFMSDASTTRNSANYSPVSGRPLFGVYSNPWAGLDAKTGAARGFLNGEPSTSYSAINAEIAKDFVNNLIYNGPALAPYFGAFRNTFNYRNVELSFNITYRFGYFFRRPSINYSSLYSQYVTHADFYQRWQKPGDEETTNVPAMIYPASSAADAYYRNSEVLIEKGDNVRLQDATIAYSLDKSRYRHLPFKQIKFYGYANNLGLIWSNTSEGIDPDFPTNKLIRTFSFGVNCSF